MTGPHGRLTRLRIRGVRTFDDVTLDLRSGVTVLIGENGSGKSTVLECLEILRRAATPSFFDDFHRVHGGLPALLRRGAQRMELAATFEHPAQAALTYRIALSAIGDFAQIAEEELYDAGAPPTMPWFLRNRSGAMLRAEGYMAEFTPSSQEATLLAGTTWVKARRGAVRVESGGAVRPLFEPVPGGPDAVARARAAVAAIDVQLPFDVAADWASRAANRTVTTRSSSTLRRTDRLERFGANLANAWASLRSEYGEAHWQRTMELVRLGLGDHIETVTTRADPAGGAVALWLKFRGVDEPIPPVALSDGTLAYLALVALTRLGNGRTLLALDEPELHLHPRLLQRALALFEESSASQPVILATHSRRLLDLLDDPASAAVVLRTEASPPTTALLRPDPDALRTWLDVYDGLGRVLDEGHESDVMKPASEAAPEPDA